MTPPYAKFKSPTSSTIIHKNAEIKNESNVKSSQSLVFFVNYTDAKSPNSKKI